MSYVLVMNAPYFPSVDKDYYQYAMLSSKLTIERIQANMDFTSTQRARQAPPPHARVVMYAAYGNKRYLHPKVPGAGCLLGAGRLLGSSVRRPRDSAAYPRLWELCLEAYKGQPDILDRLVRYHLHMAAEPLSRSSFPDIDPRRRNFLPLGVDSPNYKEIDSFWKHVTVGCVQCSG